MEYFIGLQLSKSNVSSDDVDIFLEAFSSLDNTLVESKDDVVDVGVTDLDENDNLSFLLKLSSQPTQLESQELVSKLSTSLFDLGLTEFDIIISEEDNNENY